MAVVVTAEEEIRNLVALRDDEAQNVLDLIQAVCERLGTIHNTLSTNLRISQRLDYPIDTNYKRHHLKALMKLSKASELYPKCMVLNGVKLEGNCAVAGGGFGEVWKARFNNRLIAVKMLRIFKRRDAVKILKVHTSKRDLPTIAAQRMLAGLFFRSYLMATTFPPKYSPFLWCFSL